MGTRAANDDWARRHFKNRCYQPAPGLESQKNAVVEDLTTLIGDQRLVVGLRLRYYLASLGLVITSVMAIDLSTDPVVRNLLQELVQIQGNAHADTGDFIMNKLALPIPIRMTCALFTSTKVDLSSATIPERDGFRDAYFVRQ